MAAILNSQGIDSKHTGLRFIEPILNVIQSQAEMVIVEKSVRVGMTWGSAFADVKDSIANPKTDTLFTTKDQNTAFEYIGYCQEHLELFQETRSRISTEEEDIYVPVFDEEGQETSLVEKITVTKIIFDNKSRILVFSSNPTAILAFGGNVRWDEAAFHPHGQKMWSALNTRTAWGGNIRVWSSLSMEDTMFDTLVDEAKQPGSDWEYHHIDIYEAVEAGLVEILNEAKGKNYTREGFIERQKKLSAIPSLFALNYEIKKQNSLSPIVTWPKLKACEANYEIERQHLSHTDVENLFGSAVTTNEGARRKDLERWMRAVFPGHFSKHGRSSHRFRLGFDVAASRKGDLASVWIDEKNSQGLKLRTLLTFRTEDWDIIQGSLEIFMSYTPGEIVGVGDETGLGRQICWSLEKRYFGRFTGVNFTSKKSEIGMVLMGDLAAKAKTIPRTEPDVTQDIYSIRKGIEGKKVYFFEVKNNLLPESHADIGWSAALASYADRENSTEVWVLPQ